MRSQDLEHRLHVLYAWNEWKTSSKDDLKSGATYRAVLDGCAITIRALCSAMDIGMNFAKKPPFVNANYPNRNSVRYAAMLVRCNSEKAKTVLNALPTAECTALMEVLFLGNRAIAHPSGGDLDHKVGPDEMTSAIATVIGLVKGSKELGPLVSSVNNELLI